MKKCLHCKERTATRPRGLCNSCYYDQSIRSLYPAAIFADHPNGRYKMRYLDLPPCGLPTPGSHTNARPGTPDKIAVFERRIENGEALFHPDDFNTLPVRFEELYID